MDVDKSTLISIACLMSTLGSVPRSQKLTIEPNSTDSPDADKTSPEKEQATESTKFISSLKQFSIDKGRYKHYGALMSSQDLEKITQTTKPEDIRNIEQNTGSSMKDQDSHVIERANERDLKLADVKTPKQKSISASTPATSLLSPLNSVNTSISTDKTESRPQFGDGMMGDIMQLKIEQEKTKQMQLKCELSRSVAELLKNAEGQGQATEVIKRLFFETLQDTSLSSNNDVRSHSAPSPVMPRSARSAHSSPKLQTRIVIPEPHLAPSPTKPREVGRKRPASTLSPMALHSQHCYLLNPQASEEQISNKSQKVEGMQSVELRRDRSPISEQQSRRPSSQNSTFESIGGTRALSLAESTSGRSISGTSTLMGSLSMSNFHSGAMTKDQNTSEDAQRDSGIARMYQTPVLSVNGMYPVYFAPYTSAHDPSRQIVPQDHSKQLLPTLIEQIPAEAKMIQTRNQEDPSKLDEAQQHHNASHSFEHQKPWLHSRHLYPPQAPQAPQGNNVPASRSSLPSIAYIEGAHAPNIKHRPGTSPEQSNTLATESEPHTLQNTPQLRPQQGQQLYYMNSAPVSISGNTAYVPSHYFIPPPLQPGMVSWVPNAVADRRREDEEPYSHKKRRGLKSGISFMISTPQNPPARKYNKLL